MILAIFVWKNSSLTIIYPFATKNVQTTKEMLSESRLKKLGPFTIAINLQDFLVNKVERCTY